MNRMDVGSYEVYKHLNGVWKAFLKLMHCLKKEQSLTIIHVLTNSAAFQ